MLLSLSTAVCLVLSLAVQGQDESRGLRILVVSTELQAAEIRMQIRKGASFDTLARRHSMDPSSADGGYLGAVRLSDLGRNYAGALAGLSPGEVSPVIRDGAEVALLQWLTPAEDAWRERNSAAWDLLRQGLHEEAAAGFLEAIGLAETFSSVDYRLAESLHGLAVVCMQQQRFADVQASYERALPILESVFGPEDPNVADMLKNLAEAYAWEAKYDEAEPLLLRSLAVMEQSFGRDHPDVATSLTNLGLIYSFQGRYAEAAPLLERSVAILEEHLGRGNPGLAEHLGNLAAVYREEGRHAEAKSLLERSLAIVEEAFGPEHPSNEPILASLAEVEAASGSYDAAESLRRDALLRQWGANGPEAPGAVEDALESFAALMNAPSFKGIELDRLIETFESALVAAPPASEALFITMGNALRGASLNGAAEFLMLRAVRAFPESRYIRFELGRMYADLNRWKKALTAFQEASRMDDPAADRLADALQRNLIQRQIARAHFQLRQFDAGVAALETGLGMSPANPDSLVDLGNAFLSRGRLDDASATYSRAIDEDPDRTDAYSGLAEARLRQKLFDEAAAMAKAALERDPAHSRARYLRAMALIRNGQAEEGKSELKVYGDQEESERQGKNAERRIVTTIQTAGRRLEKDPDGAIELLREAIRKNPDSATPLHYLGVAQSRLGRHEAALETFRSMLDRGLGSAFLVHMNLSREYAALGDLQGELRHRVLYLENYERALAQPPNP